MLNSGILVLSCCLKNGSKPDISSLMGAFILSNVDICLLLEPGKLLQYCMMAQIYKLIRTFTIFFGM